MLQTLSSQTPFDEVFATLEKDGGVIVEGVLDDNELSNLKSDFQPYLDGVPWGNSDSAEPDDFLDERPSGFTVSFLRARRCPEFCQNHFS